MILAYIKDFVSVDGILHTGTTWQIASDTQFTNILETVPESQHFLTVYQSSLEIPKDSTYYLRYKRHFNRGGDSEWSATINVTNDVESYNKVCFATDPYIEEPIISINRLDLTDPTRNTITVGISSFRGEYDTLVSTTILVVDGEDKVIYSNTVTGSDTKSHIISGDIVANIKNKNIVKFIVIQTGATGKESSPAMKIIDISPNSNFEIRTDLTNIKPDVNFTFKLTRINTTKPLGFSKVELVNDMTLEPIMDLSVSSNDVIIIQDYLLTAGARYQICFTIPSEKGIHKVYKLLTVRQHTMGIIYPDKVYNNSIVNGRYNSSTGTKVINIANVRPDDYMILPKPYRSAGSTPLDTKLYYAKTYTRYSDDLNYMLKYVNGGYDIVEVPGVTLPDLVADNIQNIYINNIDNYKLLLHVFNSPTVSKFMYYKYDIARDTYVLVHEQATTGTAGLGLTGNIHRISIEEFIYIMPGEAKIKKYNYVTNTITELITIPLTNPANITSVMLKSNKLFIFNGGDYKAVVYDTNSNEITEGYTFRDADLLGKQLRTYQLDNGNTLVATTQKETTGTYNGKVIIKCFNYNTMDPMPINIATGLTTYGPFITIGGYPEVAPEKNVVMLSYLSPDASSTPTIYYR